MTQPKIACPHCGQYLSKVIRSQAPVDTEGFSRRRECEACGWRFNTLETIVDTPSPRG